MKSFLLSCYPKQSCHPKFILLDFARPSFFGLKDRRIYLRSKSEQMRVSPPQEPSSFLSCWGTRYSFFSHRKEKKE